MKKILVLLPLLTLIASGCSSKNESRNGPNPSPPIVNANLCLDVHAANQGSEGPCVCPSNLQLDEAGRVCLGTELEVSSAQLSLESASINAGQATGLNLQIKNAQGEDVQLEEQSVVYLKSDPSLVIANGVVYGDKTGSYTIQASVNGVLSNEVQLTVQGEVSNQSLFFITILSNFNEFSTTNILVGTKKPLKVLGVNSMFQLISAPAVTWSSNNEAVASISNKGVVSALAQGSATISAVSTANNALIASFVVNVLDPSVAATRDLSYTQQISLNTNSQSGAHKAQLGRVKARLGLPENSSVAVTYMSKNEGVVSVDENGLVEVNTNLNASAQTQVIASYEDAELGTISVAYEVRVYAEERIVSSLQALEDSLYLIPEEVSMFPPIWGLDQLQGLNFLSANQFTFSSSDEAVVSVDENGTLRAQSEGSAIITAQFLGNAALSVELNVTVGIE